MYMYIPDGRMVRVWVSRMGVFVEYNGRSGWCGRDVGVDEGRCLVHGKRGELDGENVREGHEACAEQEGDERYQ